MTSFNLNSFLRDPIFNHNHLGVRASTYEYWVGGHKHLVHNTRKQNEVLNVEGKEQEKIIQKPYDMRAWSLGWSPGF